MKKCFLCLTALAGIFLASAQKPEITGITPQGSFNLVSTDGMGKNYLAVGNSGAIIRSTDLGATWNTVTSGTTNNFSGVVFAAENIAIASGESGTIFRTTDGGATWTDVAPSGLTEFMSNAVFLNGQTGVIGGTGSTILRTTDGGVTWQPVTNPLTGNVNRIIAGKNNTVLICQNIAPYIYISTDAGQTWAAAANPPPSIVRDISMADASTGYAVVSSNQIYKTTDGGQNWTQLTVTSPGSFRSIHFENAMTGYACGRFYIIDSYGILKTFDGGKTWFKLYPDDFNPGDLYDISFSHRSRGVTVGANGRVFVIENGGTQWQHHPLGVTQSIVSMDFGDTLNGMIGFNGPYLLKRTTDGGYNWADVTSLPVGSVPVIQYTGITTVYVAIGDSVFVSSNGGQSWTPHQLPAYAYSFYAVDNMNWFMGANSERIFRTTDGGQNWTNLTSWTTGMPSNKIGDIKVRGNMGVAGGQQRIFRSTDGGQTWSIDSLSGGDYTKITLGSANSGYITTFIGGHYVQTTDNFQTVQDLYTGNWYNDIHLLDDLRGAAVGKDRVQIFDSLHTHLYDYRMGAQPNSLHTGLYEVRRTSVNKAVAGGLDGMIMIYDRCHAPVLNVPVITASGALNSDVAVYSSFTGNELEYQWWFNGQLFAETTAGFTIQGISPADTGMYQIVADNGCGITDTQYIHVSLAPVADITGITGNKISVFPNPVPDILHISYPEETSGEIIWKIFDTSGRVIKKQKIYVHPGSVSVIPVHDLSHGIYIISVKGPGIEEYIKWIKK